MYWDELDPEVKDIYESMNDKAFMVKYATLNHLIILLTHEKICGMITMTTFFIDVELDPNFLKIFFATYTSFTSPETFILKLMDRYSVPTTYSIASKSTIRNRVRSTFVLSQQLIFPSGRQRLKVLDEDTNK